MNAQAFLALVAAHPLPWRWDYEEGWKDARLDEVPSDYSEVGGAPHVALRDAAPAMAAAILRYIANRAAFPRIDDKVLCSAYDALRASLPESLRS